MYLPTGGDDTYRHPLVNPANAFHIARTAKVFLAGSGDMWRYDMHEQSGQLTMGPVVEAAVLVVHVLGANPVSQIHVRADGLLYLAPPLD